MKEDNNIRELLATGPDWMGLIFYPKSKRFVKSIDVSTLQEIRSSDLLMVGVFVNSDYKEIKEKVESFRLDSVQLHGDEDPDLGREVKQLGVKVIKVFGIDDMLPHEKMEQWVDVADYFLFDTKSEDHGGTGRQFDWSVLKGYELNVPFLLSGGIDLKDVQAIKELNLPNMVGIDTNSKMEVAPGLKDIDKVRKMKELVC